MAARTATKSNTKPKPVKSAEESTAEVVASTSTAEATARELAASFVVESMSRDERLFEQARIAFAGLATGAKANDIAKATTTALAETFPVESRAWAESTSVVNGGAKVSRVTITQRADAYSAILRAGIADPTVTLVAVAFRAFTSKGAPGLADAHKRLITETMKRPEGERAAYYETHARSRAAAVTARKKAETDAKRSENAATKSADRKAEKPVPAEVVFDGGPSEFIAAVRAGLALPWSDDDRAEIMAALAEIVSA